MVTGTGREPGQGVLRSRRGIRGEMVSWALGRLRTHAALGRAPVVDLIASATRDPFQVLVSCILSLRTKDATTGAAAQRLFARACSARALASLEQNTIASLIYPVGFYRTKARVLKSLSEVLLERHHGQVPGTMEELLALKGVGRKTANLVLTRGFDREGICVDTHVHRIANRWGYVRTKTPSQTEMALRRKLPRRHWIEINGLLVAFGQTICRPVSPFCSRCPLSARCPKRGVTTSR